MNQVQIGCGLISIGRIWGTHSKKLSIDDSLIFLKQAFNLGVRFFDTAPSYGDSEEKLGFFIKNLSDENLNKLVIATKLGEHWNRRLNQPYIDHSYNSLTDSIDQSLKTLTKVDLLQLHKSSPAVLKSYDYQKAIDYARKQGIKFFGASVSDFESTKAACNLNFIDWIQLPYNKSWFFQEKSLDLAISKGKKIIINRPLDSGKILDSSTVNSAFKFILTKRFNGYILSGTTSVKHLQENINALTKHS